MFEFLRKLWSEGDELSCLPKDVQKSIKTFKTGTDIERLRSVSNQSYHLVRKNLTPEQVNVLLPSLLDAFQDKSKRVRKESAQGVCDYLYKKPDLTDYVFDYCDYKANEIDMTISEKGDKQLNLLLLADSVRALSNVIPLYWYDGSSMHVSTRIGSQRQHAVLINPASGTENAVASIRCQNRAVFGLKSMQQRVLYQYGQAQEGTSQLKYFKQYAAFLNIDPGKCEFKDAPAWKLDSPI